MPSPRLVEVARSASSRGELVLRRREDPVGPHHLELRVNGVLVMDTADTGSERALATAALAMLEHPRDVLVGGLGLGCTAQEVLADRGVRRVVVAEVEEDLVTWMRDGLVPHGPTLLADSRLSVAVADVRQVVAESRPASYDLVLLDVDNGPRHLVYDANAELYRSHFLEQVRRALRPPGVTVIWSADRAEDLLSAMTSVFEVAEVVEHPVLLASREESYWLHVGRVGKAASGAVASEE